MRAQQAVPFAAYLQITDIFPNSPESVSKLWRYDWCKNTCWCVVVGSNTEDCATRWWDHNGWQMDPATRACSTRDAPHTGEIFVLHSCIEVCFVPVETVAPTLKSDRPKKTLAFCCCALRGMWNSKELVCSKMEKEGSRSNKTLQVQNVAVVATWRCDRIVMVVWNLIWSEFKPHENFVLPHHLKSTIRQFDLQIIPRLCYTFCSSLLHCWQIICWTKNKHQRRSHIFQKIEEYYCDVVSQYGWIYWSL